MTLAERRTSLIVVLQVLLLSTTICLAVSMRMPAGLIAGLAVLFCATIFATVSSNGGRPARVVCWTGTLGLWGLLASTGGPWFVPDAYYLAIAGLIVIAMTVCALNNDQLLVRRRWLFLAWTWVLFTGLGWLAIAHWLNLFAGFHFALLLTVLGLVGCRLLFRLRPFVIQILHTAILLGIALPLADALLRPEYRFDRRPETARRYYSFEAASKDPDAFARWWYYSVHEWAALYRQIFQPGPNGELPLMLTPGVSAEFYESRVSINSLGFRGPEIQMEKGGALRIVALGESTTFGVTMGAEDVPWPQLLEAMIEHRLRPSRPVQVINAGFPGYDLTTNLRRLREHILPLEPDIIISYHGYNGFRMLDSTLPAVVGKAPPIYQPRPLKLLADAEYRIKVMRFNRAQPPVTSPSPEMPPVSLLENEYADAYRELIRVANENGIQLVLANYSMAVNSSSDPDVIAFYRMIFPSVYSQIRANVLHSQMLDELCRAHPEVGLIDTRPVLDGRHEKFTDVMHLTREGREALAETMFRGMERVLKGHLSIPRDVQ